MTKFSNIEFSCWLWLELHLYSYIDMQYLKCLYMKFKIKNRS